MNNLMRTPCILCLNTDAPLTEEHVFPEAAGGTISRYLLCKVCNSKVGQFIDAPYLRQKPIELVRAVHRIPGKSGYIPQPFSDVHSIERNGRQIKVRLDQAFAPRVVPAAPKIWMTEEGHIAIQISRDEKDKDQIPIIIRTALTRFFKSEQGQRLGWSTTDQEQVIHRSVENASAIEPTSERLEIPLNGRWEVDLKALFAEHVKVIYEVCCLELGGKFMGSDAAERIRKFLLAHCINDSEDWDYEATARWLDVAPYLTSELSAHINHLTEGKKDTYHVAMLTPKGVMCSMLGLGAVFSFRQLAEMRLSDNDAVAYLCGINGGESGVYSLA